MKSKVWLVPAVILGVLPMLVAVVAPPNFPSPADLTVAQHMHGHLSRIRAIKAFIIAGQLDDLREPATWLAEHDTALDLPGDWQPYVDEMRHHARQAAAARYLGRAAASVSEMARACGTCHQAHGVGVAFGDVAAPPGNTQSIASQMQHHLWASDRMWEGLIGPSDDAWNRGAEVLAGVNLQAADISDTSAHEPQIKYLLKRIREVGEAGAQAMAPDLRSTLYGEFLSLCADCHRLTGGAAAG